MSFYRYKPNKEMYIKKKLCPDTQMYTQVATQAWTIVPGTKISVSLCVYKHHDGDVCIRVDRLQ